MPHKIYHTENFYYKELNSKEKLLPFAGHSYERIS